MIYCASQKTQEFHKYITKLEITWFIFAFSKHVKLYCSEVTHEFLLTDRRFVHLESFIFSLPIEEPTTVTLRDDSTGKASPHNVHDLFTIAMLFQYVYVHKYFRLWHPCNIQNSSKGKSNIGN